MIKKALKIILALTVLLVSLVLVTTLYLYIQLPPWPEAVPGVDFNVPEYPQITRKEVKKDNAAFYFYQLNTIENFDPQPFLKVLGEPLTAENRLAADKLIADFPEVIEILENAANCDYCIFAQKNNDGSVNSDLARSSIKDLNTSLYFLYLAELSLSEGNVTAAYKYINKFIKMASFHLQTKPVWPINRLVYGSGIELIAATLNKRLAQSNSEHELVLIQNVLDSMLSHATKFSWAICQKNMILEVEQLMSKNLPPSEALIQLQSATRELATHRVRAYELYDQTGRLGELSDKYIKVVYETQSYQLLFYGKYKAQTLLLAGGSGTLSRQIKSLEFTRAKLNAIQMAVTAKIHFNKTGKVPSELSTLISQAELDRASHYDHTISYEVNDNIIRISVAGEEPFVITSKLEAK